MHDGLDAIKVVFATDDKYIPFLAVAIESLVDNSSKYNYYSIKILHTDVSKENKKKIEKYETENVSIEFVDLNYYIEKVKDKLYTRDYYTNTTYFRLFLPELYPQYNKVLYLDSDIVILDDIAKLYNINMGDNLVAAAPDDIIQSNKVFQDYVEKVVGVSDYKHYFNAGVLLMNLDQLRKFNFQEKFVYLYAPLCAPRPQFYSTAVVFFAAAPLLPKIAHGVTPLFRRRSHTPRYRTFPPQAAHGANSLPLLHL